MLKRNAGFTMLELIMVIIIIGVLAALAVPQYVSFVEKARAAEAINYIGAIKSAEIAYAAENSSGYYGNMTQIGLNTTNTPLWSFAVTPSTGVNFTVTASRTGLTANNTITFTYTNAGSTHTWAGNHIGVPKQ